jgi:hypothetical protein
VTRKICALLSPALRKPIAARAATTTNAAFKILSPAMTRERWSGARARSGSE